MSFVIWQGNCTCVAANVRINSHDVALVSTSFKGNRFCTFRGSVGERKSVQSLSGDSRRYSQITIAGELSELEKVKREERRKVDKSELIGEDPYGHVEGAMSTPVSESRQFFDTVQLVLSTEAPGTRICSHVRRGTVLLYKLFARRRFHSFGRFGRFL